MAASESFSDSLKTAREYGLGEFLEIIGELSQESTKKGALDRQTKELITLGIALAKQCGRCIKIHTSEAKRLDADKKEIAQVKRIALYHSATPDVSGDMWKCWKNAWCEFAMSKGPIAHEVRELIGLGIALVRQEEEQINLHVKGALECGAGVEAVYEVMPIALLMDGAPALSQIPYLVKAVEKYHR